MSKTPYYLDSLDALEKRLKTMELYKSKAKDIELNNIRDFLELRTGYRITYQYTRYNTYGKQDTLEFTLNDGSRSRRLTVDQLFEFIQSREYEYKLSSISGNSSIDSSVIPIVAAFILIFYILYVLRLVL